MTSPTEPSQPTIAFQPEQATTEPPGQLRTGSPFAEPPLPPPRPAASEEFDAGFAAEMARGGVLAAWLILPFALGTAWGFPLGGLLIASLGAMLGLIGCGSPRPRLGMAALLLHLLLLGAAAVRWLQLPL